MPTRSHLQTSVLLFQRMKGETACHEIAKKNRCFQGSSLVSCRSDLPSTMSRAPAAKAVVCQQSSIISSLTKSCVFGTHKTTYKYLADICRASSPSLLAYSVSEHSASQASTLAHLSLWTLETAAVFSSLQLYTAAA